MNTTPVRPRFYCRLVRLSSAPGRASRHAEGCADCRQYFLASTRLESALRRDAVRFAPPAPAGLERGIMQAIRDAAPAPARSHSRAGWFAGVSVATAAAVALAVILVPHPPRVQPAMAVVKSPAPEVMVQGESFSTRLINAVVPPAATLVAAAPLQNELDSVYSDARSALGFLALNFLPSSSGLIDARSGQIGAKG